MKRFVASASLAALACAGLATTAQAAPTAQAESVEAVAALFGTREAVDGVSMSPSGMKIAMIQSIGRNGTAVAVAEYDKDAKLRTLVVSNTAAERIRHCSWPSDNELVCSVSVATSDLTSFTRLVALYLDGKPLKVVTPAESSRAVGFAWYGGDIIDWTGARPGEVLMLRQFVPEQQIGTHLASSLEGLGVESVDVRTLRRTTIEKPNIDATDYITDGRGSVRIRGLNPTTSGGYDTNVINYFYRTKDSHSWDLLSRVTLNASGSDSGFQPVAVDPTLDAAYGFERKDGYLALYREKLDGSKARELVFSKPGIEVDDLVRLGRTQRVVGVSYAGDYRKAEYFDPELAKLRSALGKALPGSPLVDFVSSSEDESKLVMFAGSDVDPGRYYLYDKATRHLEEILPLRPALAGRKLAEMKPVQFPAADGTMIPGYLTLPPGSDGKNLPAIVMPHGGPSSRDEWGFDWLVQFFAARGFAVLQPNFRGSAGFGEAWFEKNGFQSWRTAIGDVDDAGRWLVSSGIAAKDKLAIVGWSYGGYAALQSGVLDPGLFKAIVAIAPVTDLSVLRQDHLNRTDYRLVDQQIGNGPHVAQGSPAQNVGAIQVPVLMFHGDWDLNVNVHQSQIMERRLRDAGKQVELVTFPGLAHSLDDSAARTKVLEQSDGFLRKALALPTTVASN
ncbi:dipeptidyl aminopeptidase/acylaminoacyl peptidase [Novosphingobium sp. PhB165]|uniref:alpha/beta hydrolase family protein n=1 Tax=Novosphingobium sp. PhB165 TaxID=2485105 RepID=UPI00104FDCCC|nr:S9 family peptidase [Novosphingobium sp. PhB165]TCM21974.1 dipeptidyl aminopeptidase/acylaminoacyl peptidase [Novosphingobium sp. PhB165]